MYKPGWTPLQDLQHNAGVMLLYREAGGGGDCMFHSLAVVLAPLLPAGSTFVTMRERAASVVTPENAPDVLMDMAAQVPTSLTTPMDVPAGASGGQFSPEMLWNDSKGSKEQMAAGLKKAIATPGNYLWGDATLAALVEIAMGVNIILLAIDVGSKMPPSPRELLFARTVFGRWVENMFAVRPELSSLSKEDVLAAMNAAGLTWERAIALSRMEFKFSPGRWLRGRTQPLGAIREICANPNSGNLSRQNYSASRPTVVIWNRSNVHWVPIAIGPLAETVIAPNAPLRPYVDNLMR